MNSRPAVFALLAVVGLLVLAAAPSAEPQAFNPPYLREMPTVERVKAEMKGSDPIDTAARQAGAFWQLRRMVYDLALSQHRTDRQATPDEQRLANGYYAAYYEVWQPVQKALAQDRPRLFKLGGYTVHPEILNELLERFFSPAFRAAYLKAMADMDARVQARQNADPIRVKPSAGDQPGTPSQPTAQPSRTVAAGATEYFAEGDKYFQANDFARAIGAYKKAIALDPTLANAYYSLGVASIKLEQYQAASAAFRQYVAMKPGDALAFILLGITYRELRQYPEAVLAFQTAIRLKPETQNLANAHYHLGATYTSLRKKEDALQAYIALQGIDKGRAEQLYDLISKTNWEAPPPGGLPARGAQAYYEEGKKYREAKEYAKAIEAYQQAIRLKPDYAEAHYETGWIYNDQEQYAKAISALQEALRLKPDYPTACYELGYAYSSLNQYANALAAYQQAIRLKPDYASAHLGLGMTYVRLGKTGEALQVYKNLLPLDKAKAQELYDAINKPGDSAPAKKSGTAPGASTGNTEEAYVAQADEYRKAKDYAKAIETYKKAIALKPSMGEAHFGLGLSLYFLDQYPDALAAFQQVIRLNPHDAGAHLWIGMSYGLMKQPAKAVPEFRESLRLEPGTAEAHWGLGVAYYDLEQYSNALAAFQAAAHLEPGEANNHYWIGKVYLHGLKQYEKAESAFREALRLKPDDAATIKELGFTYHFLEQYPKAVAAFQQAIGLKPDDAEAHWALGIVYVKMGNTGDALEVYRTLQKLDKKLAQDLFDFIRQSRPAPPRPNP